MLALPIRLNLAPFLTQGGNNTIMDNVFKKLITIILRFHAIVNEKLTGGDTMGIDRLRGNIVLGIHCFFLCCPARLLYAGIAVGVKPILRAPVFFFVGTVLADIFFLHSTHLPYM